MAKEEAAVQHGGDRPSVSNVGPSYRFKVSAESNYPVQNVAYQVDLYDSTIMMVYQNAAMDAIALVIAKLGRIFGEYEITGDMGKVVAEIEKLQVSLSEP